MSDWTYSSDEERWDGASTDLPSREAAIAEAEVELSLAPGDRYWTGRAITIEPIDLAAGAPDGASILESIDVYAYDNWGDEDGIEASDEQLFELGTKVQELVVEWLTKHDLRPRRFTVTEVRDHIYEPRCEVRDGACATHGEPLLCPHACEDGLCGAGCEDKTDREIARSK